MFGYEWGRRIRQPGLSGSLTFVLYPTRSDITPRRSDESQRAQIDSEAPDSLSIQVQGWCFCSLLWVCWEVVDDKSHDLIGDLAIIFTK